MDNAAVAERLEQIAHLFHEQGADTFRVEAWRRAAQSVRALTEPVRERFEHHGLSGLEQISGVGPVIGRTIRDLVLDGYAPILERLRGEAMPRTALASMPGIGPKLARRLDDELGIRSLDQLEIAAREGLLDQVAGFGPKKIQAVRDTLAKRGSSTRAAARGAPPSVSELLDVDREYREKAMDGRLSRLTPRRFNPRGQSWLPVLHTKRGDRHYTALFANTAQAHRLDKTRDWVVLYYDTPEGERQYTITTATYGPFKGQRVVRGRESEMAEAVAR